MKFSRIILSASLLLATGLVMQSCQKMDHPKLGEIIYDPEPPPYQPLKSYFSFDGNSTDVGESGLSNSSKAVTYVPGISGQAAKFGNQGYLLFLGKGDTTRYPNEFVGLPFDTLANLGSFTVSLWMNAPGPFTDNAQGVFSFSKSNEFWGNLDFFLENYNNAGDQTEAFLKFHMFNAGTGAGGNGEEWNEIKVKNFFNKWTHVALTYDAATSGLSLYIDGAPTTINNKILGGGNYKAVRFDNFNGLVIGNFQFQTDPTRTNHGPEGWASQFKGAIDNFRIYNKALSAGEVNSLFTAKQ